MASKTQKEQRILIVDDLERIHEDFRKILVTNIEEAAAGKRLISDTMRLFDGGEASDDSLATTARFRLDSAYQGEEALAKVKLAKAVCDPYKVAFVDMRMPPGWDGLYTIERIWEVDSDIQVVVCTAYSDYSWQEILDRVGKNENLLVLKKPFDSIEVHQMATALAEKWTRLAAQRQETVRLQDEVFIRSQELAQIEESTRARDACLARLVDGIRATAKANPSENGKAAEGDTIFNSKLDDLSDYLALSTGKLVLGHERFTLKSLLKPLLGLVSSAGGGRDLSLHLDDGLPREIVGDKRRLYRILVALVEDVLLRGGDGDLTMSVKCTRRGPMAGMIEFDCRADDTLAVQSDPNGLGIAELLTLIMQGDTDVSDYGSSARVIVELPVDEAQRQTG